MESERADLAKSFIKRAEGDLKTAKGAIEKGVYADACYHAQQAGEKALKSILILLDRFLKEHEISEYFSEVMEREGFDLKKISKKYFEIERYWNLPRYPEPGKELWDPLEEIEEREGREAVEKAKFILKGVKEFLRKEYNLDLE